MRVENIVLIVPNEVCAITYSRLGLLLTAGVPVMTESVAEDVALTTEVRAGVLSTSADVVVTSEPQDVGRGTVNASHASG